MGKWEPNMAAEQCLREVAARAAAALALSEALQPQGPGLWLLSAEGHLRRQPRPGCQMAAEIMIDLGASPRRIRCWPAANRTVDEVRSLDRMRDELGCHEGLLLVTSDYHVPRTRYILRRELPASSPVAVVSFNSPLVRLALEQLAPRRRQALEQVMQRGRRRGRQRLPVIASEVVAFAAGLVPGLERLVADTFRGPVDRRASTMYGPDKR